MGLEIYFKTMEEGIHVFVDDECDKFLDEKSEKISGLQKLAIDDESIIRRKYLLCMNKVITDAILHEIEDKIVLYCPICGKEYTIKREVYDQEFEKFLKKGE